MGQSQVVNHEQRWKPTSLKCRLTDAGTWKHGKLIMHEIQQALFLYNTEHNSDFNQKPCCMNYINYETEAPSRRTILFFEFFFTFSSLSIPTLDHLVGPVCIISMLKHFIIFTLFEAHNIYFEDQGG